MTKIQKMAEKTLTLRQNGQYHPPPPAQTPTYICIGAYIGRTFTKTLFSRKRAIASTYVLVNIGHTVCMAILIRKEKMFFDSICENVIYGPRITRITSPLQSFPSEYFLIFLPRN